MSANPAQVQPTQRVTHLYDYIFSGDDYTVSKKCDFIRGLIDTHTVYRAAQIAGISKKTAYNWYCSDEQFAEAWEEALNSATEDLETCMFERAKAKDTLAGIFLLKKYNPEFRDKVTVDLSSVQEQIDAMISKADQRQLPAVMTEFIDTGYSNSEQEYQVVEPQSNANTLQFSSPSEHSQKEESPSDLSDSHS